MTRNSELRIALSKCILLVRSRTLLLIAMLLATSACAMQREEARGEKPSVASVSREAVTSKGKKGPTIIAYAQFLNRTHWFVADFDGVWKTADGGETWTATYHVKPKANVATTSINGLSFIDRQTGFLLVERELLRTDDGGTTWNKRSELDFDPQSCHFTDAQNGWAVGRTWLKEFTVDPSVPQYVGAIFNTRDAGRTWQQQRVDLPKGYFEEGARWYLSDVYFSDRRTGWTVGFGVVFWTIDGGDNWHIADAWKGIYQRVRFLDSHFGWATQRNGAEFSITTDGGKHWTLVGGPPTYGSWPTNVVFITPEHGYASLVVLYETKDGGRSWDARMGENQIGKGYEYIGRALDGTLVALGVSNGAIKAFVSNNDGITWDMTK